ncbi:Uncharacterised protein [Mycobacteroides abscessus]|nr:Uncharacterised protein [Mycobacteroides abscessus]
MRASASASTASTPSSTRRSSGASRPSPAADRASRRRWRVSAKARPSNTAHVSNTPSPTVTPWSTALSATSPGATRRPSAQITRFSVVLADVGVVAAGVLMAPVCPRRGRRGGAP